MKINDLQDLHNNHNQLITSICLPNQTSLSRNTFFPSGSNFTNTFTKLIEVIKNSKNLLSLNLSGCNLSGEEINALFAELQEKNTLVSIDLSYNRILKDQLKALGHIISQNQKLTGIDISHNILGINDGSELYPYITQHENIRTIKLANKDDPSDTWWKKNPNPYKELMPTKQELESTLEMVQTSSQNIKDKLTNKQCVDILLTRNKDIEIAKEQLIVFYKKIGTDILGATYKEKLFDLYSDLENNQE